MNEIQKNRPRRGDDRSGVMKRALLLLVLAPLVAIIRGTVLFWLWGWFAVPVGAPRVVWVHAIGLVFLVDVLCSTGRRDNKEELRLAEFFVTTTFTYALFAFYGWLLHACVGGPL
jgi:hypothetical protein